MDKTERKPNRLAGETSPYLLQHAYNPVDWYPWGEEAFEKARREDKPVFLSIGYSTCHWCHVMARESFEDEETAALINDNFVPIKVDREERPDIDSIYMAVCEAFTGSGGWPTTVFLTPEQRPFFAGTYFPMSSRGRFVGLRELLSAFHEKWVTDRETLIEAADETVRMLNAGAGRVSEPDERLLGAAEAAFREAYDAENGGFGLAPKFPTPHNLMFLMALGERHGRARAMDMACHTLRQMRRGGIFDQIGGGFCRYSTDSRFLVPHFEKMLYDNALLIMAYSRAARQTGDALYLEAAQRTAAYVLRELTSPDGAFFSAQDADSDGGEGRFYLLTPSDIAAAIGDEAADGFCLRFGITEHGNFEGGSIPNLLGGEGSAEAERYIPGVYAYRRQRGTLRRDDKVLTAWNSLMIAALCHLARSGGGEGWLDTAARAQRFIESRLCDGEVLYVSFRDGRRGEQGFLDDYACYVFALLALYEATLKRRYLDMAERFCTRALEDFGDGQRGGFYLYGGAHERLIARPKQTHDGALPSGNSMMAWVLVRLWRLTGHERWEKHAVRQLGFMSAQAAAYPAGHTMFLLALLDYCDPPAMVSVAMGEGGAGDAALRVSPWDVLREQPAGEAPPPDGRTTFYVCRGHTCLPPAHELSTAGYGKAEK